MQCFHKNILLTLHHINKCLIDLTLYFILQVNKQ